MSKSSW